MTAALASMRALPRRGLSREEAATYVGISTTKFDELLKAGSMPEPRLIGARKIWDVRQLDIAFDELPCQNAKVGNSWDDV